MRKILPVFLFALTIGAGLGLVSASNITGPSVGNASDLIIDLSAIVSFQFIYLISVLAAIISISIALISRPEILKKRNIIKG